MELGSSGRQSQHAQTHPHHSSLLIITHHHPIKVGNFRVEPPGLFRGRGEHPKMGKVKKRVYPRDITINIGGCGAGLRDSERLI